MYIYKYLIAVFVTILLSVAVVSAEDDKKAEQSGEESHIRTVKEAQAEGNYVYIKIEDDGKDLWIASMPSLLKVKVEKGDQIEYMGGVAMKDFESKAMDMTFDSILFVSRIRVLKNDKGLVPDDDVHKVALDKERGSALFIEPKTDEIEKTADGKSIAEIFNEKSALKDTTVVLRGKVMKVSKNIMKKNWVTVKDGTGTAPEDKLIVLTTDNVYVNDILLFKGTIKTDVNLGSGYKYSILLDEANIISQ